MTNILLSSLQTAMADMVYYTSAYTEMYTLYVQEANKSSSEYNKKGLIISFIIQILRLVELYNMRWIWA